ncbi:MAG TPA: biotin/lipoyl-binding protein, partial [Polyangiaceae bacterium]
MPEAASLSRSRVFTLGALVALRLGAAFLFGYLPRHREKVALAAGARDETESVLQVEVVSPKVTSSDRAIVLSGSVRALEETVIYPRANGYIAKWLVDIGDKVKEGQTMAEIETPELDQEL